MTTTSITVSQPALSNQTNIALYDVSAPNVLLGGTGWPQQRGLRILMFECRDPLSAFVTRFYQAVSQLEITMNAAWDGSQWVRDPPYNESSKLSYDWQGGLRSAVYVGPAYSFPDSGWSGEFRFRPFDSTTIADITLPSSGVAIAAGAIDCFAGAEAQQGSSGYLGTGVTFPKTFPASPSWISTFVYYSGHVSSGPSTYGLIQPFGTDVYCQTSPSGDSWFYVKVTVG